MLVLRIFARNYIHFFIKSSFFKNIEISLGLAKNII